MNQCFNLQLSPGCCFRVMVQLRLLYVHVDEESRLTRSQKSITIANIINDEITTNTKQWHTITYKYTNNKDRSENKGVHG